MFGNVCGPGCQYQAQAQDGAGGWGARRWGRVRGIMTITVSWGRPRVRGARGHRSRGRAVIKESNDLPSAVLIFFP